EHKFLVAAPPDAEQPSGLPVDETPAGAQQIVHHPSRARGQSAANAGDDLLQAVYERMAAQDAEFEAMQSPTSGEDAQLRAAHEQLKTEYDRLSNQLERAMTDLKSIRTDLGGVAPTEVRPLIEERASLSAEVGRLRSELQVLRDAKW